MKLALITDTHYGIRNDHNIFNENNKKFLDNVFFPTLEKEGITTVVHLGDLLDRRKYVNFYTSSRLRKDFIEPLLDRRIAFHWILGNHDIYYRQNLDVSCASELFSGLVDHEEVTFVPYINPTEVMFGDVKILFVPWVCDANREQTSKLIEDTDARICFGHLELSGFEISKGMECSHGEDRSNYQKFNVVCSGHFHHKSHYNNIDYLGSHSQFTWIDYGDPRGMHIFDTDTLDLTFIRNPYEMFAKVLYDDRKDIEYDFESFREKFVHVVILSRKNAAQYDNFISRLEEVGPIDLQVSEDHLNLDLLDNDAIMAKAQDTLEIINDYVSQADNVINHGKLKDLFVGLYKQAGMVEK